MTTVSSFDIIFDDESVKIEECPSPACHRSAPGPGRLDGVEITLSFQAASDRQDLPEYFEILKDTLILHEVPAWRQSQKRKPLTSSKYYFFDVGVASALQGRLVKPGTPEFGPAFETWILHELLSYRDYLSAAEEKNLKRFLCVSLEDRARQVGVVRIFPYRLFLDALWAREFTP